jgi:hypothetical protein
MVHKKFNTQEESEAWMEAEVNDACVDNHRFAYLDDAAGMLEYEKQKLQGCCGFFDEQISIAGRMASIGCNYGH